MTIGHSTPVGKRGRAGKAPVTELSTECNTNGFDIRLPKPNVAYKDPKIHFDFKLKSAPMGYTNFETRLFDQPIVCRVQ